MSDPHRMTPYREDRRERLRVVALALFACALDVWALAGAGAPLARVCAVLVSIAVLAALTPGTVSRVRGLALVPTLQRTLVTAAAELEAGGADAARTALEAASLSLGARLGAYRFVVLTALAYARMHSGDVAGARVMLDDLAASGWLDHGGLRRTRATLIAGHALARVQLGDLAQADSLLAKLGQNDETDVSVAARALLAVRRGVGDTDVLEALANAPAAAGRTALSRLVRLGFVSVLAADDPRRATQIAQLREGGRRPLHALGAGWPSLYALAQSIEIVGPAEVPAAPRDT